MERESRAAGSLVNSHSSSILRRETNALAIRGLGDLAKREMARHWLEKGLEMCALFRYEESFPCFERALQLRPEHPEAQFLLGQSYWAGEGVEKNDAIAAVLFRAAAENGHAEAQDFLADAYAAGEGVAQDYEQAIFWWRKAAEQGHAAAQCQLGREYRKGEAIPRDPTQSLSWYQKAADQGFAEAQYQIGKAHYEGLGGRRDRSRAVFWWQWAAEHGHRKAKDSLRNAAAKGNSYAQRVLAYKGWG